MSLERPVETRGNIVNRLVNRMIGNLAVSYLHFSNLLQAKKNGIAEDFRTVKKIDSMLLSHYDPLAEPIFSKQSQIIHKLYDRLGYLTPSFKIAAKLYRR
jgi:hypothetical protein